MKEDRLITIKGCQRVDDQEETTELMTVGAMYQKEGSFYIIYNESEATGYEGSRTTVKIDGDRCVTLMRSGANRSQLVIERGVRHQCNYDTGYGSITVGISGDKIITNLTEEGGRVDFKYSIDLNTNLTSENMVSIHVRNR